MKSLSLGILAAAVLCGCGNAAPGDAGGVAARDDAPRAAADAPTTPTPPGSTAAAPAASVLDHVYRPLAGRDAVNLRDAYGGDVLLVVNTASKCGFTPQYEGLEALHARLSPQGFAVLGFPSNDFRGQEPGSEEEIRDFCTLTYGVKFPMFEKVVVTGDGKTPLYRDLAAATGEEPGWNFHKYLIDRAGRVVASYPSRTAPDDPELLADIERLLALPAPARAAAEPAN